MAITKLVWGTSSNDISFKKKILIWLFSASSQARVKKRQEQALAYSGMCHGQAGRGQRSDWHTSSSPTLYTGIGHRGRGDQRPPAGLGQMPGSWEVVGRGFREGAEDSSYALHHT